MLLTCNGVHDDYQVHPDLLAFNPDDKKSLQWHRATGSHVTTGTKLSSRSGSTHTGLWANFCTGNARPNRRNSVPCLCRTNAFSQCAPERINRHKMLMPPNVVEMQNIIVRDRLEQVGIQYGQERGVYPNPCWIGVGSGTLLQNIRIKRHDIAGMPSSRRPSRRFWNYRRMPMV